MDAVYPGNLESFARCLTYYGLVSVWVVPRDSDYADGSWYALRDRWMTQIEAKFRKTTAGCFGTDLYRQATFSNGEAFFQPVSAAQRSSMELGYSSKEGWL